MSRKIVGGLTVAICGLAALAGWNSQAAAQALTIYEIQYTTAADGSSPYDYQVVDCAGGVVVRKFPGFRPRLVLQDPAYPDAWGAIQVKDWTSDFALYNSVEVGDWVEFTDMLVEEFRGGTFLQWQTPFSPGYNIVSVGNDWPEPIVVEVGQMPAPIYDPDLDGWFVEDHQAEPLESMRLIVRDVSVGEMDLGKARDNYVLENAAGDKCWAADYMNEMVQPDGYHPFVTAGQHFCAVSGLLEQYTRESYGWDYYQLITQETTDLAICGDGDADGDADLDDLPRLLECITGPLCDDVAGGCIPPAWTASLHIQHCLMMDLDYDGDVDLRDYATLQQMLGGS